MCIKKVEICAGLHLFHLNSGNVWKHDHCFLQPFLAFSSSTFVKQQMYSHDMKLSHEKIVFFATFNCVCCMSFYVHRYLSVNVNKRDKSSSELWRGTVQQNRNC